MYNVVYSVEDSDGNKTTQEVQTEVVSSLSVQKGSISNTGKTIPIVFILSIIIFIPLITYKLNKKKLK